MNYSYYPGCTAKGFGKDYEISSLAVLKALGVRVTELKDWNCCGSTIYTVTDELRSHTLAARNLAIAEKENEDLLVICPACFIALNKTNKIFDENSKLSGKINDVLAKIGLKYSGSVQVRHLLDILVNDIGENIIRSRITKQLEGLKVAPYYGCQIVRPYGVFDDPEFPVTMSKILDWTGAEPVNWPLRATCCGGMLMMTNEEIGLRLVKNLLKSATENSAEYIATACTLCRTNLEFYQDKVNKKFKTKYEVPIVYVTQLLGLALGLSARELALEKELVPAEEVLLPI